MNLKSTLLCAILCIALTTTGFSNFRPGADAKTVIKEFAESHINTDASRLEKILSSDVQLKFSKGTQLQSQSQLSIIKLMRQNQGIKQNCSPVIDILASSEAMVLARVNFIYDSFVIENFLTLELDRSQNWKITRINKFFTDPGSSSVLTKE